MLEDEFEEMDIQNQAIARSIDALRDEKKVSFFSDLTDDDILMLSMLKTIFAPETVKLALLHKANPVKLFADNYMKISVSKLRKGRIEIVDIAKGIKENVANNPISRFFGGNRV